MDGLTLEKINQMSKEEKKKLSIKLAVNTYLCFSPSKIVLDGMFNIYKEVSQYDKEIEEKYKKDFEIFYQGKGLFEDDNREISEEEINIVTDYINRHVTSGKITPHVKKIWEKLITIRPEYKKWENKFNNPIKKRIAIVLPRREDQK